MRLLASVLLTLAATPGLAIAQAQDVPDPGGNEKINQVIVYGDQPCPASDDPDLITICVRVEDQYRIPEPLRGDINDPRNQAWAARAEALEYVGKSGIGSCSPSGSGGASGCFAQLVRQARAERRQGDGTNWVALVEEARQERLGTIDERSEEIEARVKAEEAAKAAAAQQPPQ